MMQKFMLGAAVLLSSWALPKQLAAQTYFNNPCVVSPFYSGATNVLPVASGYWLAGSSGTTPGGSPQALFLQQLDLTGHPVGPARQWTRAGLNYFAADAGSLMRVVGGGMALVGSTDSGNTYGGMLWRFNARGDTLWTRTYTGPPGGSLIPRFGRQLPDGDFVLVGELYPQTTSADSEMLLLRTDSSGIERWRRTYNVNFYESAWNVLPLPDGGFLLSGGYRADLNAQPPNSEPVLLKTDSLGQEQWRRIYAGPYEEEVLSVFSAAAGGYLVSMGRTEYLLNNNSQRRPGLLWIDSLGNVLRERYYGSPQPGLGIVSVHALIDGGYVIGGYVGDTTGAPLGRGFPIGFALRVCADGDSVWYRTYQLLTGGRSHNYLRDVRPTPDGGFVGAGFYWARPPDTGINSAWVFKTDQYGYLQPGGAPPTVQCRPTGLPEDDANGSLEVWPNPSADGRFHIWPSQPGTTSLCVTDALGRLVWRGTSAGAETVVDLSRCAPGLYLLRVQNERGRQRTYKLLRH